MYFDQIVYLDPDSTIEAIDHILALSRPSDEAMEQEMEDLRLTALALARLDSFDKKKALSHDFIKEKFGA